MSAFEFTTAIENVPVKIDGEHYRLRTLNGAGRDVYLGDMMGRTETDPKTGKATGKRNMKGFSASLLSLCLFRVVGGTEVDGVLIGGEEFPVAAATIDAWPSPVVSRLFDKAKQLAGLDAEDEGKNVSAAKELSGTNSPQPSA